MADPGALAGRCGRGRWDPLKSRRCAFGPWDSRIFKAPLGHPGDRELSHNAYPRLLAAPDMFGVLHRIQEETHTGDHYRNHHVKGV